MDGVTGTWPRLPTAAFSAAAIASRTALSASATAAAGAPIAAPALSSSRHLAVGELRRLPGALGLLRDAGHLADRTAQTLERVADLARHDPQLVRVALSDRRQHLQVLVGEQTLVRLAGVDRVEDRGDGLRLTLGLQDPRLPLGLRPAGSGTACHLRR